MKVGATTSAQIRNAFLKASPSRPCLMSFDLCCRAGSGHPKCILLDDAQMADPPLPRTRDLSIRGVSPKCTSQNMQHANILPATPSSSQHRSTPPCTALLATTDIAARTSWGFLTIPQRPASKSRNSVFPSTRLIFPRLKV